ncbi:MAG: GTP-binding protein [Desulfobacterium sp.]
MIVDIVYGFLGSGKTTFITKILEKWGSNEKTVVLVNEFGDVGIDGDLLSNQGGNVVEMPSGCICCTLQADFRSQMLEINRSICPERVIVEPTGVATIAQIQYIFQAQLFENAFEAVHYILIADATGFMSLYKANRHFVESQVRHAHLCVLNKCDKVDKRKAMLTQGAISAINPDITVMRSEFGAVDWSDYQFSLATSETLLGKHPQGAHHSTLAADPITDTSFHENPHEINEGKGHIHLVETEDALGYESFGRVYSDSSFEPDLLDALFEKFKSTTSQMGDIVRAKGVFRVGQGWILMELASREFSSQRLGKGSDSKISIIGKGLNRKIIGEALEGCQSGTS